MFGVAVGFDFRASLRTRHAAKDFPEFTGRAVIRERWLAKACSASSPRLTSSNAVNLVRPLIRTKEK